MGAFGRAVATMGTGTALAVAVPVVISPLLTRLYDPSQLGVLALYLSILAVLAVVATGRFELALPLVRRTGEAQVLLRLCLGLAVAVATTTALVAATLPAMAPHWLAQRPALAAVLPWLPLGLWLLGSSQALNYAANRQAKYRRMAGARVAQALITGPAQILAGLTAGGAASLVAASVLGQAVHAVALWQGTRDLRTSRAARPRATLAVLRRHRAYPVFMIPGQLANVCSAHAPVLMLAAFFDPAWAGFFALAERVLLVPAAVLGTAIGDVYRQHAADEYHAKGHCRPLFLRTAKRLALAGLLPLAIVMSIGPALFSWVFGAAWSQAGEVAALVAPMSFLQLVSTPLSQTVLLGHLHRLDMIWQFVRLILAAVAFAIGIAAGHDAMLAITLYAAALSIMYVMHSVMQYHVAAGLWRCSARGGGAA